MPLFNPDPPLKWEPLTLESGWQRFPGYDAEYAQSGQLCYLRGLVQQTGSSGLIATLAVSPPTSKFFLVVSNNGSYALPGYLYLENSGQLFWGGFGGTFAIALDQVFFSS